MRSGPPASLLSPSVEFRNRLIGETVRAAARESEFYGELYRGLDLTVVETVEDLRNLPTVDKAKMVAAGKAALCSDGAGPIVAIQNTSGTTGVPFWLYRSQNEQAFIREFFEEWNSRDVAVEGLTPLVLQLVSDRHGVPTGVPSDVFPFACRLMDRPSVEKAIAILSTEFDIPGAERRVSAITGSHDDLVVLTTYMLEKGISPASAFQVRRLSPIGRYMTRRFHAFLASTWNCRITQRYSLAEIFGGASWIDDLKAYVFDPYLVPEVLSFSDSAPLTAGVGRLHLTGLRPFSVMQPLIRYRPGDLFEVATGEDGVTRHRFLGREAHALFNPRAKHQMLANGLAALEALDPHPEFNRDAYAIDIGLDDPTCAGWPRSRGRIEMSEQGFICAIQVETRCDMRLFPERAERLRHEVIVAFLDAAPALEKLVAEGQARIEVTFSGPGTLAPLERTSEYWRW